MRRANLVVPHLVADPDGESALRDLPAAFQRVVEGARVVRLRTVPESTTPEAAFLALDPGETQVAQGPLTVAALGHSPPADSVHFHLTLCTVGEDGVLGAATGPVADVFPAVERLRTRSLIPLQGEGLDHALVWEEGSTDLTTTPPDLAFGGALFDQIPRGEGEGLLRRFIDDSVNLLDSLEMNHVRREEGLAPLNCLWPWGHGFRPSLPNLPLRRGDVAFVESASMRLHGLCRLVGYVHGDRARFGKGLRTNFEQVRETVLRRRLSLIVLHSVEEMRRHHRTEEISHTLDLIAEHVVEPLLELAEAEPFELRIVSPGEYGLALAYSSLQRNDNAFPFDERALDEARLPQEHVWETLLPGLVGEG